MKSYFFFMSLNTAKTPSGSWKTKQLIDSRQTWRPEPVKSYMLQKSRQVYFQSVFLFTSCLPLQSGLQNSELISLSRFQYPVILNSCQIDKTQSLITIGSYHPPPFYSNQNKSGPSPRRCLPMIGQAFLRLTD